MTMAAIYLRPPLFLNVNRHSTVTHDQRPNMTHPQEGGTGGEVSEILFFSAKSKRRPSLIYSMQIIPVCLSIVARRKGVSATRRGGLNWTPISLLVGHPCKLFNILEPFIRFLSVLCLRVEPRSLAVVIPRVDVSTLRFEPLYGLIRRFVRRTTLRKNKGAT